MAAVSFGKRVGEGTSQAVERITQVSAAKNLDAKLRDVERALGKLDDGTYGTCDRCGEPIAEDRLEAIPWAVRCMACASIGDGR
jgi:DnaK suppressor protein